MRIRTFVYFLIGLLLALVLIGAATAVQTHNSSDPQVWLQVQRQDHLLWMLDGCAVIILLGTTLLGATFSSAQKQMRLQSEENARQLAQLTERTEELFRLNSEYAERIGDLETSGADWHAGFEAEAHRLTEQAFLALNDHVDMHTRQLEAIHLAMRHQRAEIKNVRGALRTGALAPEQEAPSLLEGAPVPGQELPPRQTTKEKSEVAEEPESHGLMDQTLNAGSTVILETVEFEIADSDPDPEEPSDPETDPIFPTEPRATDSVENRDPDAGTLPWKKRA